MPDRGRGLLEVGLQMVDEPWSGLFLGQLVGEFKVDSATSELRTAGIVPQYQVIIIPSRTLLSRLLMRVSEPLRTGRPVPNLDRPFPVPPPDGLPQDARIGGH